MADKKRRLEIRLTQEEFDQISKRMEDAGIMNRSAFIRKMAIDGYVIRMDLSDVREVVRLLRINSNNLNQYAKKANETGSIYISDIKELQLQHEHIWDVIKGILQRLSEMN